MKSFNLLTWLGVFIWFNVIAGNYVGHNGLAQQNQLAHLSRQITPSNVGFREIDDLDRKEVLQFTLETLIKTVAQNDLLKRRLGNKISYDDRLFNDDATEDDELNLSLQSFFEKMSSASFTVRNLTIIIALVYMDKVSQILHLYANSRNVRRLFGGCLIIASKIHRNEVLREELADSMDLSIRELVNIESAIVQSVKDLTVHPQVLINYLTPLMGSRSSQSSYTQPENSQYNYYR